MPDFEARIASGAMLAVWTDPATADGPSRINPHPAHPPRYQRVELGSTVTVKASVAGVEGPPDSALGGRLFTTHFAEVPIWPPPAITTPPGSTSIASFVPNHLGHHLVVLRRQDGGAVALPFFVETAT